MKSGRGKELYSRMFASSIGILTAHTEYIYLNKYFAYKAKNLSQFSKNGFLSQGLHFFLNNEKLLHSGICLENGILDPLEEGC